MRVFVVVSMLPSSGSKLFADLGSWPFKFMRTLSLSSLLLLQCPISLYLCYICSVVTFVFLFVFVLVGFGRRRQRASLRLVASDKIGDMKYRRNVFTVTPPEVVLIATTAYCH